MKVSDYVAKFLTENGIKDLFLIYRRRYYAPS